MARNFYIGYNFEYNQIFEILKEKHIKKINFFFDLQSICTGFYNRDVVLMEVSRYVSDGQISDILLHEYRQYLINLFTRFKQYDPYFVTFFDDGRCSQNRALQTEYKSKNSMDNLQVEVENLQLFRTIKKYYFSKIHEQYNLKPDVSKAFYLKEFEADLIPHYCISKNLYDSKDPDVANFILSKDKDLLQTCQFNNTFQIVSGFKPSQGRNTRYSRIFDNESAIEYIYPNFRKGFLNSKHIALILAICGDKADVVTGISGVGPAKAVQIIQDYSLPTDMDSLKRHTNIPDIFKKELKSDEQKTNLRTNFDRVISNLRITDFNEQIKRTPMERF